MKTVDLIYAIIIIVIFLIMFAYSITVVGTKKIKENWSEYKCNPIYMPFSKSIANVSAQSNMEDCMKSMQSNYMDILLEPIQYSMDVIDVLIGSIIGTISDLQNFTTDLSSSNNSSFGSMFSGLGDMVGGTFDIFGKVIDMLQKVSAITTVIQYTSQGLVFTAGSLVSTLTGSCFHPDTMLLLQNGKEVAMKDINLGDILINGSLVEGTMWLNNLDSKGEIKEKFYNIKNNNTNKDIYVTGSHLVKDKKINKFVRVEHANQSKYTNNGAPKLCCLITNDHRIVIGDQEFWDWEDEGVQDSCIGYWADASA